MSFLESVLVWGVVSSLASTAWLAHINCKFIKAMDEIDDRRHKVMLALIDRVEALENAEDEQFSGEVAR